MTKNRIWFNKSLSVMEHLFYILKKENIVVIHTNTKEIFTNSDEFYLEPEKIEDKEYIDFCIEFCKAHNVNIFYPWRFLKEILKNKDRFEEIGVKIYSPVSDHKYFDLVNNKKHFYDFILKENIEVNIPDYFAVSTKEDFISKYEELNKKYIDICMKPSVGIFASGYKRIYNDNLDYERLLNGTDKYKISFSTLKFIMPNKLHNEILVMKFLEGNEYSYDCLCINGEIIDGSIRVKYIDPTVKYQKITHNLKDKFLKEYSAKLVKRLNLSGFVNIQYIDDEKGIPNVLEINPRMSGGFYKCEETEIKWSELFIKTINILNNEDTIENVLNSIEYKEYDFNFEK